MGVSSADPDHLDAYVAAARDLNDTLRHRLGALVDAYDRVVPRLQWGVFDARAPLEALATYIGLNDADDEWVATIAARFRAADSSGGAVALDDAAIDGALRAVGVGSEPRSDLTVDDPIMAGAPPTSGFAADPVCTATGHFVEREVDLVVPSHVAITGWVRTYSSRWLEPGPFGRGWASWASVRLEAVDGGAVMVLPDGRRARFVGDGSGRPVRVSGLCADLVADEGGWELRWFDQDRWSFDRDGRLVAVTSPVRGTATFHGELGRLERIVHAGGRSVSLEWSGRRVGGVRASDGRVVRYRYDGAGDLVEVVGPGPCRRRYEVGDGLVVAVIDADGVELVRNGYDPEGRVRWQRSPFGRRTTFRYPRRGVTVVADDEGGPTFTHLHDPAGRLVGVVDDHGARMTKVYDRWGNPAATSDRTGAVVSQAWDERGRLLRREEPDGAVTAFEWDEQDRIVARTDACGAVVRLSYRADDREPSRVVDAVGAITRIDVVGGLVVGVTDPDGVVTRFERNRDGLITAMVDGLGARTGFGYDDRGALVHQVDPGGGTVRFDRDATGRVVGRVDADGTRVGFEWTDAGRLAASITATGARSVFGQGEHGEVVTVEDAGGAVSRMEWDVLGRLVAMTNPAGTTVRHRYDGLGRLVSTTDGCGAELRRAHDAEGRVVALVDGEGGVVRREHDAVGRLVAAADAAGRATRFEHDQCGRLVSITEPSGRTTAQARDAAGRVVVVTGPDGATTRYRWTPGGRLRSVTAADGAVTRYGYDRAGRLVSERGPGGSRTFERDAAGRVVAVTTGSGAHAARTALELDGCGRVTARTDACGDVTRWAHHPTGRVASVEAPGGGTSRFGFDPAGRLVSAVDANGAETTYRWDAAGFLTGVTDPLGGVQVHHNDPMGRLVAWTDQLGHRTDLHLDWAGRLIGHRDPSGVEVDLGSVLSARIDTGGRSAHSESGPAVLSPRVRAGGRSAHSERPGVRDACGRIVARDGVSYEYRHGKVVAQGGPFGRRTFTYDPAGQLIARRDADGRSWRWAYDACGRRVEQVSPEGTDRYRYDAAGRLLEVVRHGPRSAVGLYRYDSAGRRTHEIHGELGRMRSIRYRWDELGRLREIRRRESGRPDAVTRIELDQAGDLVAVHGDLDGLEWLHFRTLDVATGMFLSPDPLPGVPGTPVVANPYHYAANDPVGLRDPFGLAPLTDADLEAMREAAGRPVWQKAYDSTLDLVDDPVSWAADHWETVAAAGLVVVGGVLVATGVGAPIGAGILVGASMAFASQVALTGEVDQRSLLVSTAAGAVGGGVGGATSGLAVTSQVAIGAGTDMALSAGAQYATTGTVDPHQVVWDGVIGASTGGVGAKLPWAPEPIPLGFRRAEFNAFRAEFRIGLADAGYGDALPAIRGSSMTGIRHRTGLPLDELGPDDFDLAVVGDRLFEDAKAIGMKPRDGRRRTGPMREKHVEALGLAELQDRLSALAPRKVSFMAYRDIDVLAERGPYKSMS